MRLRLISGGQAAQGQPESCAHSWRLIERRERHADEAGKPLDPPAVRDFVRCEKCGETKWV